MSVSSGRLLVFGRVPEQGKVKTRLIPALGARAATALYARLLDAALRTATGMEDVAVEFWCDAGAGSWSDALDLARRYGVSVQRQKGADLGARMHHAFASDRAPARRPCVLIGSDCPGYDRAYLATAFRALEDADAVLGPAMDGGYALIGVQRINGRLFDGIPWSTPDVLAQTRVRLRALGWCWRELAPLRDVDRPEDLAHFPGLFSGRPGGA